MSSATEMYCRLNVLQHQIGITQNICLLFVIQITNKYFVL